MGRTPMSGGTAFRFLPAEVADMEKALDASNGATPARSIVETLAEKFTNSSERSGQKPVQWKQVWNWFQNRRHAQKAKIDKLKGVGPGGETPPAAKPVILAGPSAAKKPNVHVTMDFEAKSARDGAWYDVSAFINKRTGENGEPEVRVRFAGFGSEEDEWVNIATAVRQRSLPCETTECVAVLPGDLILCFQEGSEQALYFDADILDVQRRRHDVRGCRCRFWVRYRHDQTEEVVPLRKVCRRPETEQRLQQAREANASSNKFPNKDIVVEASAKPLNGIPNSIAAPQLPPTTPATPLQLSAAFTATPLPGASSNFHTPIQPGTTTPGLTPVQPLPMQSLNTPDVKSLIHHHASPTNSAAAQQDTTAPAVSAAEGLLPSAATAAVAQPMASTSAQQQTTPSIESSLAHQLSISTPAQQHAPPVSDAVEPAQQQLASDVAITTPGVFGASDQEGVASTGVAETSNVDNVKPTPVVQQTEPSIVVQVDSPTVDVLTGTSGGTTPMEEETLLVGKT